MRLGSRWRGLWRDGVALGRRADPSARLLLLAGGVGALGGLVAGVFDFARFHLGRLALGGGEDALAAAPAWWLLLLPTLGGVVAGFLVRWTTQGRGPIGVPRLIHATQLAGERLPLRDGVGTALGALVALVTGHSGGREAPVAGLTASIAEAGLARLGISGAQARVLAAAGAAGAIAASFNTPLGSAILAMELFLGSFALRHFGPVVTATVVGTLVGQALLGERVAFHPPPFVLGSPWELLAYAGLGVACALVARGFTALIGLVDARAESLPLALPLRLAAGGAVVGVLAALGLRGVMGTGYPLVDEILADPSAVGAPLLLALLVGKLLATSASFSARAGPGLFSPVLVVGATTGALYAVTLDAAAGGLLPSTGSYGLVAMGAVAAAVFKAPIAMTLVLFELTGNYAVVPTMLLTVAVSAMVSLVLEPGSLYDALLRQRGVDVHRELPSRLRSLRVEEVMRAGDVVTVPRDSALPALTEAFGRTREDLVWVVDGDGALVGGIDIQDALDAVARGEGGPALDLMQPRVTLQPLDPPWRALEVLRATDADVAPVVDAAGRPLGVVSERALLEVLGAEG